MRIKNDVIIKYYQLINTMYLSNEEFGALVRNIIMEDDNKKLRYENVSPLLYDFVVEKEEEWKNDFKKMMKENQKIIESYATVSGQTSNSHKAFDQKQKEYDEKDKQKKIKEIMKSENCSYEEALDTYNFMQPAEPKAEPKAETKDKTESKIKNDLHNFNIFGIPFSFEYSSDTHFTNEQLEKQFSDIKEYLATDEELFKRIVNDTFKSAIYDNFQKDLKEYYDENN